MPTTEIDRAGVEGKTASLEINIYRVIGGVWTVMPPAAITTGVAIFVYSHAQVSLLTALQALR